MATTKIKTELISDGAVTSDKLDTNISIAGNVSIGTSSAFPSAKLQIKTATDVNLGFQTGTTLTTGFKINAYNDLANANIPLELNASTVLLKTLETERMRITSDGTVYVSGQNSGFDGTIRIGERAYIEHRDTSNTTTSIINNYNNDASKINFKLKGVSDANAQVTILGSGNLGIGTSNPTVPLTVKTNTSLAARFLGRDSDGFAFLSFRNSIDTVTNGEIGTSDAQNMLFYAGDSERMRLEADGDLHVDGDVIAYSTTISDERLKDDIQTIDNALDKVSNLRGVSYTWNNGNRKGQKDLGLIAQEVEQVLPELVREKEMPMIDGGTYKTVDYEKIVGVLIEAVKELKAEVESLKSK